MKVITFLTISLLAFSSAQGIEHPAHAKAALLKHPLPEKRVDTFVNGQALAVRSVGVLGKCVKNLKLTEKWGLEHEAAVKKLADITTSVRETGTDFIRITVTGKDEAESKELLEGLIEATCSTFGRRHLSVKKDRLETLDDELQKQADIVQDRRKAFTVLMQQYGIPYFDGRDGSPVGVTEEALYRKSQEKLDQLEQDSSQLKIQIEKLLQTSQEDLIRTAAGLDLPNNQVTTYYNNYREHIQEISSLQAQGLAEGHPKIKSLQAQAKGSLENAQKEVITVKEILKTRLILAERQVARMKMIVDKKQTWIIDLSMAQHNYEQARRQYEAARDLLGDMRHKQQRDRIQLNMHQIHYLP